MNQTFEEYIASSAAAIGSYEFFINIMIAALLSLVLGWVYSKYVTGIQKTSKKFIL